MLRGLGRVETDGLRLARLGLAAATALAAALLLWAGRGTSFFNDELFYFGRVGVDGLAEPFNLTYVLEPFHGHLQAVGKLVYELLFATAGTHYFWYRLLEVVLLGICVALFFELTRVRVGPWAALAGSVVLLFLGAGWEVLLWPFDLHTLLALAACLTAILALERDWPRADLLSCALLVLAMATIEIGVAFAVGIAVSVLMRPDRRSRVWVFAIPLVLYAAWSLWARHFGQAQIDLAQLSALATSMPASLAATVSSLTGLIDPGGGSAVDRVGGLGPELVIAVVLVIAFVWRISVAPVRPATWVFVATLLTYWVLITLAGRLPDTTRYMPIDALLVLLIAADLIAPTRVAGRWLAAVWVVALLAIPLNLVKLFDGRDHLVTEAELSRAEFTMIELARDRVAPDYRPTVLGPGFTEQLLPLYTPRADAYLEGAARIGSLAMPLGELRGASDDARRGADLTLIGALGLAAQRAPAPVRPSACDQVAGTETEPASVQLPPGGGVIGAEGATSPALSLARFGPQPGLVIASPAPGHWSRLAIPPDSAPDPWRLDVAGEARICPLEGAP